MRRSSPSTPGAAAVPGRPEQGPSQPETRTPSPAVGESSCLPGSSGHGCPLFESGPAGAPDRVSIPRQGLLLFAHGARDPRWAHPFVDIAARARAAQPTWQVELAFLEFMTPDLRTAGQRLAERGCARVDVVPLFLGAGGHVRRDLPALLQSLAADFPAVDWRLRPAVGEMPGVVAAMAEAAVGSAGGGGERPVTADLGSTPGE